MAVLDLLKTIMIIINSNSVSRFYCPMTLHLSKNYNIIAKGIKVNENQFQSIYSQLSPCRHLTIRDTPIIRAAALSSAKINYRHLTEKKFPLYYGLSLLRTLTHRPEGVRNKQQ